MMRQGFHFYWQRPPGNLSRLWLLLLLALICTASAATLRADDTTRRVQEELRKRNLYFGDVDGRRTGPFVAALRHYQERKGFFGSGDADEQTLRSLDLPELAAMAASFAPPPAAAVATNPNPATTASAASNVQQDTSPPFWPDMTVVRSDEGRRTSPDPAAANAINRIIPGAADPISPPARFNSIPPPSFTADQGPSAADVKDFITRYLQAGQTNNPEEEAKFYGNQVDYFNQGKVDRNFVLQDIRRYNKRWPDRNFVIIGNINVVADANNLDHTLVRFRYRFKNRNAAAAASGEMEGIYTLSGRTPSALRLIHLRERHVR